MSFLRTSRPPSPTFTPPAKQPGTLVPAAPHAHEPEAHTVPLKPSTHQRSRGSSPFGPLAPSSLFEHYADGIEAKPAQQRNDHTRDVLSNSASFLLRKVDANASQIEKSATPWLTQTL